MSRETFAALFFAVFYKNIIFAEKSKCKWMRIMH